MIGKIEKYNILEEIFVSRDTFVLKCQAEEIYAMKLLVLDKTSQQMIDRFKREMRIISTINHPNIILGGHDCGLGAWRNKKCFYYLMEYVNGPSLGTLLQNGNKFNFIDILTIALETLKGLIFLKKKNIVHRDIKPSNILINSSYQIKIADLGLAKIIQEIGDNQITLGPTMLGTPYYLAPERIFHSDIDYMGDIYSLGATLYEMLSGFPPFRDLLSERASLSDYIDTVEMYQQPTALKDIHQSINDEISDLVSSMLLRDKNLRPPHEKIIEVIYKMIERIPLNNRYPTKDLTKIMGRIIQKNSAPSHNEAPKNIASEQNVTSVSSNPNASTPNESITQLSNFVFFKETFVILQKYRQVFHLFNIKNLLNSNEKSIIFNMFRYFTQIQKEKDILGFIAVLTKVFRDNTPVVAILSQNVKIVEQDLELMAKAFLQSVKFAEHQNTIKQIFHSNQQKKNTYLHTLNIIIEKGICSKVNVREAMLRLLEKELK